MSVLPFNFKHTSSTAGGSERDHRSGLRPRRMVGGLSALSLAAVLALAGPAGAAEGDPAGNNGTIKIDGVTLDDAPNNEPHPGCDFEVDFYGFDHGVPFNATVVFAVHNPTRGDDVLEVDNDVVLIGGDANDGGGSEPGLDASQGYNLYEALTDGGYEPGRMGYHIKLTIHADGSIGADTKSKVFWVTDCAPAIVPPLIDDEEVVDEDDDVVVVDEDDDVVVVDEDDDEVVVVDETDVGTPVGTSTVIAQPTGTTDVLGQITLSSLIPSVPVEVAGLLAQLQPAVSKVAVSGAGAATPTGNDAEVLGKTLTRPDAPTAPGGLARTGSAVAPSLVLAAILLLLGTLARRFGRAPALTQP